MARREYGDIIELTYKGAADMGVGVSEHPGYEFIEASVHFSGTGATKNDLTIDLDSAEGDEWDTERWKEPSVGLDRDVVVRIPDYEQKAWTFHGDDRLVFNWANAHDGTLYWALTVKLRRVNAS